MSCNLVYKNNKLDSVVADNGSESLLYKEALKEFGEKQGLEIYLASKSDDFQDNIILSQSELDVNNEPKLKTVLNYLSLQNESKEPLTTQQKLDLRNISLGVENFSVQKLIDAFYVDGIFNVSPKNLKKSGLYSNYEIANLANDINLQQRVKQSLEALKNTEDVDVDTEFTEGLEKTDEVNSFGKLVNLNPYIIQKEVLNKLATTTEDEFESNLADLEYPNFQKNLNKEVAVEDSGFSVKTQSYSDYIDGEFTFPENRVIKVYHSTNADIESILDEGLKVGDLRGYTLQTPQPNDWSKYTIELEVKAGDRYNSGDVSPSTGNYAKLAYENPNTNSQKITEISYNGLWLFYNTIPSDKITKIIDNETGKVVYSKTGSIKEKTTVKEQLFQEMQGYKKAEVFMEVDGEIVQAKNTNTAVILPLVAKQINNFEILQDINQIQQYDLDVLQANQEDTVKILKGIEDNLIGEGIDVVGLAGREINENLMSFLGSLETFINTPTVENTKVFADVYDTFFEKDLLPKTEIVKQEETDRDFVKLNTNLSEEQVYEQQGLIKVKDGLYIRTNKQDLDALYVNLETYKDKYPKDVSLREYVQTQVAQLEDFKNSNNAEAVYLYKMYFDIEDYRLKDLKKQALEARNINSFLKDIITDFDVRYINRKAANTLVETSTTSYVDSVKPKQEVDRYMVDSWKERISNGQKPFVIIRVDNSIDGHHKLQAYKELGIEQIPVLLEQKLVDFYNKIFPIQSTKNNANFTGDFEYLTTDFVSDFYIDILKEREKNSELYKNFYSNFDINENGIYLKNDDSVTMSQINEYADENLRQYSIISKQMPLLVEQDIQSETKQVRRDAILNNPQNLEKYQGQFHKLNDNNIILKNSDEEFIKVEGNIFEAVDSDGNLTLYSRLNSIVGEYYNFNNKAPKTNVKIEEYSYLNTQPQMFINEKKYLSKSAKEKINQENFDCI